MTTKNESILSALHTLLGTITGVVVERNTAIPEEIPDGDGLIIVRDGDTEEPEEVLNGFRNCYYTSRIDIEIYVSDADQSDRDGLWDTVIAAIGSKLESDLTLGGLIHGMRYGQPSATTEPVEGGHDIKQAVMTLTVEYQTTTPLG